MYLYNNVSWKKNPVFMAAGSLLSWAQTAIPSALASSRLPILEKKT